MKITSEKARAIIYNPKTRNNWLFIAENLNGVAHWNKVTGEILWIDDHDGLTTLNKPKKAKA